MPDKNICRMLKDNGFCRYRKEKAGGAACSGPGYCKYYNTTDIIVEKNIVASKPKKPSKRGNRPQLNLVYDSSNGVDTTFTVENMAFQTNTISQSVMITAEELRSVLADFSNNISSTYA